MTLNTNFGIFNFKPLKVAIEIVSIGPNIQARGILKYSATIALGKEIINIIRLLMILFTAPIMIKILNKKKGDKYGKRNACNSKT